MVYTERSVKGCYAHLPCGCNEPSLHQLFYLPQGMTLLSARLGIIL